MKLASNDFNYILPQENIALKPTCQRDRSKLLVFCKKTIKHHVFRDISELLPPRSTLFFNDTKVIRARLFLRRHTGGQIEIMLLNPIDTRQPISHIMDATDPVVWHCAVKNIKKWQKNTILHLHRGAVSLEVKLLDKDACHIEFSWEPRTMTFSQMMAITGNVPLPPYLGNRGDLFPDNERYQTVYSRHEGGVAAPTAGLHFSSFLIEEIRKKDVLTEFVTLHVSGATFQPIRTDNIFDHAMHAEQLTVTKKALDTLLIPDRKVIAVGTTSMRVLESLYWLGVQYIRDGLSLQGFYIDKIAPYKHYSTSLPTVREALEAVREGFPQSGLLIGETAILILPGYKFHVCKGLITNFHLPGSTLIPLVASFVGESWRNIYDTAIRNGYRFLSYGDSSLLLP